MRRQRGIIECLEHVRDSTGEPFNDEEQAAYARAQAIVALAEQRARERESTSRGKATATQQRRAGPSDIETAAGVGALNETERVSSGLFCFVCVAVYCIAVCLLSIMYHVRCPPWSLEPP